MSISYGEDGGVSELHSRTCTNDNQNKDRRFNSNTLVDKSPLSQAFTLFEMPTMQIAAMSHETNHKKRNTSTLRLVSLS